MTEPDVFDQAAHEMAAALEQQPPEVQRAYRYLFCCVALREGLLELVGEELRPSGTRLVCQVPATGALYTVDRPLEWTVEEEEAYVNAMCELLIGSGNG